MALDGLFDMGESTWSPEFGQFIRRGKQRPVNRSRSIPAQVCLIFNLLGGILGRFLEFLAFPLIGPGRTRFLGRVNV